MQGEINDLQTHMYYQKKGFDNLAEQNSYEQVALTGIGEYCFINSTVSKYEGKETGYSLNLILTPEAEGTVREVANRILDAAQNPNWEYSKNKKVPKGNWMPREMLINKLIKEKDDGTKYIVCKAHHLNKDGERVYLPIFNRFGQLPEDEAKEVRIFGGSKIAVEVTMYVYYLPTGMQGIKVKLRSVQILEDNKSTGSPVGSSFKFDQQGIDEEVPI